MVQVKFGPREKRKPEALRVFWTHHGVSRFYVVGPADCPVRFLALIKYVQRRMGLVNSVRIDQKNEESTASI